MPETWDPDEFVKLVGAVVVTNGFDCGGSARECELLPNKQIVQAPGSGKGLEFVTADDRTDVPSGKSALYGPFRLPIVT